MFGNWKRRALTAESRLAEQRQSTITLELRVNGASIASYRLVATSIASADPSLGDMWASGDAATFVIDVPLVQGEMLS